MLLLLYQNDPAKYDSYVSFPRGIESSFLALLIDSIWWSVQMKTSKFSMKMSQILPAYAFTEIQILLEFLYIYLLNVATHDPDFC